MQPHFLIHHPIDQVGVAVTSITSGTDVKGIVTEDGSVVTIKAQTSVPRWHKIALREIAAGETILEYAEPIGAATQPIRAGEHVHTHNLRTLRW